MKILRWIAVLPAAIIGSALIYVIARFFGRLFDPLEGYGLMGILYEAIYSGLLGAAFVSIGSIIAPDYNKTTSVVLATIGVIFCIVSMCIQLFVIKEVDWQIIVSCIAVAIGCIGGASYVHEDKDMK